MSLATRLAGAVLALSLVSLAVATVVGVGTGFDLGRDVYESRLASAAEAGAFDVAAAVEGTSAANESLAISPQTVVAIEQFAAALDVLRADTTIDPDAITEDLVAAYDERYLAPRRPGGRGVPISEVIGDDPAALHLQRLYAVETVDALTGVRVTGEPALEQQTEVRLVDDPARIENAGDGSEWSAVHDEYHAAFRRVVEEFALVDLYLVEPDDATVVYSVQKRPDLGTSLVSGPSSGSVLANTVNAVIDDPTTTNSNLRTYVAGGGQIVGVIASPVFDGERLAGVIATMFAGERLDAVLQRPPSDGVDSHRPDVFLVGSDGRLLTNPAAFRADPAGYLAASEASGQLRAADRAAIAAAGSVALIQPLPSATAAAAARGDTEVERRISVTGAEVFTTARRVPIDSPAWFVVGELGFADAEAALGDFRSILVVGASLFVIAIAFFAVGWAQGIVRPVKAISARLADPGAASEPLEIAPQSPVEMHRLVDSFTSMAATLERQRLGLALAREERLGLMRSMLPSAVADRLASGELDGIDEVPQATVVVVVVLGLGELVRHGGPSRRGLVDQLHGDLDEFAEHHGLDRIKVVGDAYFASCGHDRPFIDHAPRVVTFATDARDAVRELGRRYGHSLDVAAGVHTGPVRVGMTGGARLVYDVWGDTVATADHLARRAGPGVVLVSDEVKAMLPAELDTVATTDESAWRVSDAVRNAHREAAP